YSPDRRWPILYAFDPFARGKTAVEVYKLAAEKYGYIVAASNNSKNGPVAEQLAAAQAVWLDTHRRFAIDKDRVYTTGLSGGARVATSFALYCYTCAVDGVAGTEGHAKGDRENRSGICASTIRTNPAGSCPGRATQRHTESVLRAAFPGIRFQGTGERNGV